MNTKIFGLSIIGIIISFFGGFYLANSLNNSELNRLRAENEQFKKTSVEKPQNEPEATLSDDEIKQKIAEADKNPTNISFQRDLGMALYRYGAMKQDVNLVTESGRLLQRAFDNNPKDYDVVVMLGNVYYDIASIKKDDENYKKARDFYLKALEQKPEDADVRADYGSTYIFSEPADLNKAVSELQKSLQTSPKNERAYQFLIQGLIKQNKIDEAEKNLAKLQEINPNNQSLPSLANQIANSKTTSTK